MKKVQDLNPSVAIVQSRNAAWMDAGFTALIFLTAFVIAGFLAREHGSDVVRHTVEIDARLFRGPSALKDHAPSPLS